MRLGCNFLHHRKTRLTSFVSSFSTSSSSPLPASFITPRLSIPSERHTEFVASLLACYATSPCTILLFGDVGMGKTAFARAFLRTKLGIADLRVPSPTYPICIPYTYSTTNGQSKTVHHMDLYRVATSKQFDSLRIEEAMQFDMCLIEWPEKLLEHLSTSSSSPFFPQASRSQEEICHIIEKERQATSETTGRQDRATELLNNLWYVRITEEEDSNVAGTSQGQEDPRFALNYLMDSPRFLQVTFPLSTTTLLQSPTQENRKNSPAAISLMPAPLLPLLPPHLWNWTEIQQQLQMLADHDVQDDHSSSG